MEVDPLITRLANIIKFLLKKLSDLPKKQPRLIIESAILAVLVIIASIIISKPEAENTADTDLVQTETSATTTAATSTPTTTPEEAKYVPRAKAKPPVQPAAEPENDYEEIVKKYGSWRFQFNGGCQASPASMTVKNGSYIMLDNRSGSARSIMVGDKTYGINPFDYAIVQISASNLPTTLSVACGGQYNVAQINVQP